jgi:hypothetical protein
MVAIAGATGFVLAVYVLNKMFPKVSTKKFH